MCTKTWSRKSYEHEWSVDSRQCFILLITFWQIQNVLRTYTPVTNNDGHRQEMMQQHNVHYYDKQFNIWDSIHMRKVWKDAYEKSHWSAQDIDWRRKSRRIDIFLIGSYRQHTLRTVWNISEPQQGLTFQRTFLQPHSSFPLKRSVTTSHLSQESCAIAKMTAQCALHMGALKIFGTPWLRPLFPTFSWAFVPIDPINVPTTKFEVCSFTRSRDNRGTQKIWAVPAYAHATFSPKFLMGFYSDWPCKCTRQIWSP